MRRRIELRDWSASQRQTADGAVESEQRVTLDAPVLAFTEAGASRLGGTYWSEVERSLGGLVRCRVRSSGLELRVLGRGPTLLRFGPPELDVTPRLVRCRYPIAGGFLAQRAEGEISFAQATNGEIVLRSTIRRFFPTLAAREGEPHWTGTLYNQVQSRIHVAISRRYFARLIREAQR